MTLNSEKLKRYKDLILFIIKHANSTMLRSSDTELELETTEKDNGGEPEKFAKDIEDLGPTFIKMGQLFSTRTDLFAPEYIAALSRLQDNVEPFSFEEVEKIVAEELGVRISKAFREFIAEPIAAASLGQVHKAITHDGKNVAVKVQRPNIRSVIINDLEALDDIASALDKHTKAGEKFVFREILQEFRKTILKELDYRLEAQNLTRLHKNLEDYNNIVIPLPVEDYTTSKVLTMDFVKGTKITSISPLAKLEIDSGELIEDLFKAYLDQVLVDGFFHADPHPGNVFITDDRRIALIDLGMTARVDPAMQDKLLKLMLYISEGRGYEAAELSIDMSAESEISNRERFIREVSSFVTFAQDSKMEQIQLGKIIVQLTRIASGNGYRTSPELTMLGKTLLNLDEIGRVLNPDFNPNAAIRKHTESIVRKHLLKNFSPGNFFSGLIETKDFVQKLPVKLNRILDNFADNNITIKTQAFDESQLTENFQKVANRITLGLVLGALIVGAAMLMRVDTAFTLFGYPGFAMIMFLIAALCGFGLVFTIMFTDKKSKKKKTS